MGATHDTLGHTRDVRTKAEPTTISVYLPYTNTQ